MKIIEPGHIYQLGQLDLGLDDTKQYLTFVNREPGYEHSGTMTQEVLRVLIDRTHHCDNCLPDDINADIIYHLKMALVYHEMRALRRKAEKGLYDPSLIHVDADGHFRLLPAQGNEQEGVARRRVFPRNPAPLQPCTYRSYQVEEKPDGRNNEAEES